jgi:L-asparaginase II
VHQLVARVWRNGFAESEHHGSVIGLDAGGTGVLRRGEPELTMFPRSSNKPMQALAMLRSGLDLDGELLALACSSHSGEGHHLAGVRRILTGAGLTEDDLGCTADHPLDETARQRALAAGQPPRPVFMNCSGKHAAMLATCVAAGWPTESYLDPGHPLQRAIGATLSELAGEPAGPVAVDGCGAPLYGLTLIGLARAFRRLATAPSGTPEAKLAAAMGAHPEYVGGTGRDVTALLRALPGSVAKDGAEGVYAIGLPDGRAVAVKIADGSSRARAVVLVAALRELGVTAAELEPLAEYPVLGHGAVVGAIRPVTGPHSASRPPAPVG